MQNCNLATQIKDSVSKHLVLTAIDQAPDVIQCSGPEQLTQLFSDAIEVYPPAVWRLPITVALMSIRNEDLSTRKKRKKLNKSIKTLCPVIRASLKKSDVVVRYGAHRIAFLFIGSDEVEAGRLCQRVKEAIHKHSYFKLKLPKQLDLEFAISQHDVLKGNDIAELIFGNERNIRVACAMGEGAIVTRKDVCESFQEHKGFMRRLGETVKPDIFEFEDR